MNTEENRRRIEGVLGDVAEKCRRNRALVLTESDLKCQVYSALMVPREFGELANTFDHGIRGSSVHTETKFFDHNGLLRQAPDLVVTDPRRISITQRLDGDPVPSKGFHFDGPAILIELKFLKRDGRPSAGTLGKIEGDIMKGETLNRRGDIDFHLFVAVFDRFHHGHEAVEAIFDRHRRQRNLTCLYFPGGPSFRHRV
ncbi:MAG: hypothetical protein KF802_14650 [Bdellovibrionaceae bacterium]|nr:hypothetical protein [Pseudobdellovibrionaceae bacterium]